MNDLQTIVEDIFGKIVRREIAAATVELRRMIAPPSPTQGNSSPAQMSSLATAKEVAAFVQTSVRTLRRLTLSGRFPGPVRVGKRAIRWRKEDVEAWASAKERKQ